MKTLVTINELLPIEKKLIEYFELSMNVVVLYFKRENENEAVKPLISFLDTHQDFKKRVLLELSPARIDELKELTIIKHFGK